MLDQDAALDGQFCSKTTVYRPLDKDEGELTLGYITDAQVQLK